MENHALKDASEAITTLQNWESMKPNEVQQVIDRLEGYITQALKPAPPQADTPIKATQYYKFEIGDRVTKVKGSRWTGRVVGYYSTELTPNGYCIESETETGSVQIYPEAAIISATPQTDKAAQREDVSGENLDIPKELQMTTAERDALRKATTPAPIDADVRDTYEVVTIDMVADLKEQFPDLKDIANITVAYGLSRVLLKHKRAALKKGG